ncbi:uncharacterized protein LOC143502004 [Brachyhypopomus gauderio]|uniref:uncharacterized protein LOC143502004 n=1 Tax=Brachyhypopomus gauderio TaxID=698409 RepID=UPI0040429BCD
MRSQTWLRKKWLWVAGGAFVGLHFVTWIMQKTMKRTVRTELELKQRRETED